SRSRGLRLPALLLLRGALPVGVRRHLRLEKYFALSGAPGLGVNRGGRTKGRGITSLTACDRGGYRGRMRLAPIVLGETTLTLEDIAGVAREQRPAVLGERARASMLASRAVIDAVLAGGADAPLVYGVNTGFGALAEV